MHFKYIGAVMIKKEKRVLFWEWKNQKESLKISIRIWYIRTSVVFKSKKEYPIVLRWPRISLFYTIYQKSEINQY